jgi:hypothetical protein
MLMPLPSAWSGAASIRHPGAHVLVVLLHDLAQDEPLGTEQCVVGGVVWECFG